MDKTRSHVDAAIIAKISQDLDSLQPKSVFNKASALAELLPSLRRLRDKGYTFEEISRELAARGLKVGQRSVARALALPKARRTGARQKAASAAS
jgi:hypothetical protein